jgi:hypothetical protein
LLAAATGTAHAGDTASPACAAVLASNAAATILPTVRMIAPYVPYSRWRLSSAVPRNLAGTANETEQARPAINAGFLGECGFSRSKENKCDDSDTASWTDSSNRKEPPSVHNLLARQAEPQVSCSALGGCGSLVEVHGGSEGPPQHGIVDAGQVPFENRRPFRIIERSDRFAHVVAGPAKERWCRRSPPKAARVDLISQSKRRRSIFRIGGDGKTQKEQQPLANLLFCPILGITCGARCARLIAIHGRLLGGFAAVACGHAIRPLKHPRLRAHSRHSSGGWPRRERMGKPP